MQAHTLLKHARARSMCARLPACGCATCRLRGAPAALVLKPDAVRTALTYQLSAAQQD